jgi:ABC-type phosphate transport system substrate-binding protein
MKLTQTLLLAALAAPAAPALALAGDVVIIVNKANDNNVDKGLVVKIYLGESKSWGNGSAVAACDLPDDNPERAGFASQVVGRTPANMKALWAQNLFAGKAIPPKQYGSDDAVKKAVAANKNAIGYIKASSADDSVKVVVK